MIMIHCFCLFEMFWEAHVGLWRGPTNDDERFFVSADFKCFRKGV